MRGKNSDIVVKRPSFFWLITEAIRAASELSVTYPYHKIYRNKNRGDGHPVMVFPGFMATKDSTKILERFIAKSGYAAYDWGLDRNWGKLEYLEFLTQRLEELYHKHQEPVSLIGWSLGGVFARQIAKERPEMVRQVITMGSPFMDLAQPNNIAWLHTLVSGGKKVRDIDHNLLNNLPLPAPVPTTAIYSKEDGIVPWRVCMETEEDAWHQNVQVHGSHCGLGVNTSVLQIIADRLRFHKDNWTHFRPSNILEGKLLYPSVKM